jgi:hypothetical protein
MLRSAGKELHSIYDQNPGFRDISNWDFSVPKNSPVFKAGIKPLSLNGIGLNNDFPEKFHADKGYRGEIKKRTNTKLDLFVLIGQSNMSGRGNIEFQDTIIDPMVFMLNKSDEWVPAKDPLHFDKTYVGTGLGFTFGKIVSKNSKKKIGLIPCAVGGTTISQWMPGAFDKTTNTHPYDDAVRRIKIAMENGRLKGILWHQGEGDSDVERVLFYKQRFDSMLVNLKNDLSVNMDKIPIVIGELDYFFCLKNKYAPKLNDVLLQLSKTHKNIALVKAEGLTHKGDSVHFDAASQRELGRRYAEKWIELESQK